MAETHYGAVQQHSGPTRQAAGNSPASSVSRRQFIKGVGAGAAAAWVAPRVAFANILNRTDRDGDRVILGKGEHTYEVVKGWGKLPAGIRYGNTHGVIIDSHGRVFIHNMSKDSMCVFDPDGKFIKSWGPEYQSGAHGLQLHREGKDEFLFLAATGQHTVSKTTLDGDLVWRIGYPKECAAYKSENQYVPTNVAIAPNGDFYVADGYGLSWIHQYSPKAEYIRSWGGAGTAPGKLNCPHGIWIDTRHKEPLVLVADRSNVRLQYFKLDGTYHSMVTDELRAPCHFDQRHGEILIPDLKGRVTIFDKHDKLVCHLGDNPDHSKWANNGVPPSQWVDGQFCSPHAAVWDRHGNIYVVEWLSAGRVTKLRRVDA